MKKFKMKWIVILLTLFSTLAIPVVASDLAKASALRRGDTIAVVAPASPGENAAGTAAATRELERLGYRVRLMPATSSQYGFFAGTDEARAKDVNDAFADNTVKAIVCLNGGYGSARILDKLDYKAIHEHPKLLIGFSDITALHVVLAEKAQVVSANGPMMITLDPANHSSYTMDQLAKGLTATTPIGPIAMPAGKGLHTVVAGKASGSLIGGNLSMIAAACGTPYELRGDDAILVLEEVNEDAYRVDRMLQQLWQNGLLSRVKAIVYGEFLGCSHDPGDFTTDEVLDYYAKLAGKPAVKGLPLGHGMDNVFLPWGVAATVEANPDGSASLVVIEGHNYCQNR